MQELSIVDLGQARRVDLEAYRDALDELVEVQAQIDRLEARRARALVGVQVAGLRVHGPVDAAGVPDAKLSGQVLEFAHRSMRAEVAMSLRVSEYSAGAMLSEAEILVHDLPETLTSVEVGRLTFRAASTIAGQGMQVEAARRGEFDEAAVRIARDVAPSRLKSRLAALRERLVSVPSSERHASARAQRRVTIEDVEDGMSWLSAYLPSVEAHAIDHRLTGVARAAQDFDVEDGILDDRMLAQRRADLLVDLIAADYVGPDELETTDAARERRFARGHDLGRFNRIRPTVVVTVPVMTLLGRDDVGAGPVADPSGGLRVRPASGSVAGTRVPGGVAAALRAGTADPPMLDGIVPIDPVTARELTANASSLYRLLVDPHRGVGLDLGRARYQVSTELRLWLRLRDGTCRFPGCGRPAKGCDVDHTIDGSTAVRPAPTISRICVEAITR